MIANPIPNDLVPLLWKHQTQAIRFALRYLRAPAEAATGLIRMPTGTGKTGVVAVLSVALPPPGWTLVLTPWSHLCNQMVGDIQTRFWKERGWKPPRRPDVTRLYPSTVAAILGRSEAQLVVVATFATLVTMFKRHPEKYRELADRIAQVFVDEGHYEPAVEWGQAVKQLRRPTVLLTATPYRNDLKLFRISKKDVHHYTHKDAEGASIVRPVTFRSLGVREPTDRELPAWCDAFASFWKGPEKRALHKQPRAIICCANMATVRRVTSLLRKRGIDALGIHERFTDRKVPWLKQDTPDPRTVAFDVWVHQNKLTEGLDDHRFCVVAVLHRIRNDRKLIQQIGRVLRRGRDAVGRALVLYSDGLTVEKSWDNYRAFETQPDFVDPDRYHQIIATVLRQQPAMEYFGGRFRHRLDTASTDLPAHVLLPPSAVVRRIRPSFKWSDFTDYTSDALLLEDRILLGPDRAPFVGPLDSRLWVYALFGNSPLLIEHSQYEIRLGATAAVRHGGILFAVDTEGMYPAKYLFDHTHKLGPGELGRIFGATTVPKEVSLTNPWPAGPTVRRSTIFADDLGSTPAQLTDAVFVCTNVRATLLPEKEGVLPRRHYVGFQRGRISEQIRSTERAAFSLREFVEWTRDLAALIDAPERKLPDFFQRYLSPTAPPAVVQPAFLTLNLFEGDVELQDPDGDPVALADSMVAIDVASGGKSGELRFSSVLRYGEIENPTTRKVTASLAYEPDRARFWFRGDELNGALFVSRPDGSDSEGLSTYLNNNDDMFTIALAEPDVYYTAESFYRIDYAHAETRLAGLLTPVKALARATSEKGAKAKGKTQWDRSSVFGLIAASGTGGLIAREFGVAELLLCDDLGKEVADFVCVNFSDRKIAFIHAKHGKDHVVSASALHDVVAQALKNLGVLSRSAAKPANLDRWNREAVWPGTRIRRWSYGAASLPIKEALWAKIRSDILDHPDGRKEVWLVVGQTLEKEALLGQLTDPSKRDAVTGHVVHLLASLHATCTQITVKLRVFCD
jgi:superfamily II DNA or RNA helicase